MQKRQLHQLRAQDNLECTGGTDLRSTSRPEDSAACQAALSWGLERDWRRGGGKEHGLSCKKTVLPSGISFHLFFFFYT